MEEREGMKKEVKEETEARGREGKSERRRKKGSLEAGGGKMG